MSGAARARPRPGRPRGRAGRPAAPRGSQAPARRSREAPAKPGDAKRGLGDLARELLTRAARAAGRAAAGGLRRAWRSPRVRRGLVLAAFGGGLALASTEVRDRVRASPRYQVRLDGLRGSTPPPGLTARATDDLACAPFPSGVLSLYDGEAVARLAAYVEGLPWVAEVRGIEARFPDQVAFGLRTRRPAAFLEHRGELFLLDGAGVVLPRDRYAPGGPGELSLPVLVGAPLGHREVYAGDRLAYVPIRHGLAVAASLSDEVFRPLFEERVTIDVANTDGRLDPRRSEIVVRAGGAVIEWGRSPVTEHLAVPEDVKLRRLQAVLARAGGLERLALVRLQFDDVEWKVRSDGGGR